MASGATQHPAGDQLVAQLLRVSSAFGMIMAARLSPGVRGTGTRRELPPDM